MNAILTAPAPSRAAIPLARRNAISSHTSAQTSTHATYFSPRRHQSHSRRAKASALTWDRNPHPDGLLYRGAVLIAPGFLTDHTQYHDLVKVVLPSTRTASPCTLTPPRDDRRSPTSHRTSVAAATTRASRPSRGTIGSRPSAVARSARRSIDSSTPSTGSSGPTRSTSGNPPQGSPRRSPPARPKSPQVPLAMVRVRVRVRCISRLVAFLASFPLQATLRSTSWSSSATRPRAPRAA